MVDLRAVIAGQGVSSGLLQDEIPPSHEAKTSCLKQLLSAASRFDQIERFPSPHIEAGGDGDLRCEWNRSPRCVSVVFSATGKGRLHVFGSHGVDAAAIAHHELPNTDQLVKALRWVAGYADSET